jgi:hypothetical protein
VTNPAETPGDHQRVGRFKKGGREPSLPLFLLAGSYFAAFTKILSAAVTAAKSPVREDVEGLVSSPEQET